RIEPLAQLQRPLAAGIARLIEFIGVERAHLPHPHPKHTVDDLLGPALVLGADVCAPPQLKGVFIGRDDRRRDPAVVLLRKPTFDGHGVRSGYVRTSNQGTHRANADTTTPAQYQRRSASSLIGSSSPFS